MVAITSASKPASRGKKKAKHENPLAVLLSDVTTSTANNHRISRLQLLLFCLERHQHMIEPISLSSVVGNLLTLASGGNSEVQPWALMCLASLASAPEETSARGKEKLPDWESAWRLSLHLSTSTHTSRAACHLGCALRDSNTSGLQELQILKDLDGYLQDISIRGPSIPCDSVCRFLGQSLHTVSRDVRLSRKRLEENVLWWLSDKWHLLAVTGAGASKSIAVMNLIPDDMLYLLAAISGFDHCPEIISPRQELMGFLPGIKEQRAKQKVILDFMLHVKLPAPPVSLRGRDLEKVADLPRSQGEDSVGEHRQCQLVERSLLKMIEAELDFFPTLESVTTEHSVQRAYICIFLLVVSLLYEALASLKNLKTNSDLLSSACTLAERVLPGLFSAHWTPSEQLSLVQSLLPLVSDRTKGDRNQWIAMLRVTERSGMKTTKVPHVPEHWKPEMSSLLVSLWNLPKVSRMRRPHHHY